MAFMGTAVVHGRAKGVVVETGQRTVPGQIATEVQEASTLKAPLQEKFDRFARKIGLVVLVASVLLFVAGILTGEKVKEMFMTVVAAAVAAIPEGLPVVVTITLAIGVTRWPAATPLSGGCRPSKRWGAPRSSVPIKPGR